MKRDEKKNKRPIYAKAWAWKYVKSEISALFGIISLNKKNKEASEKLIRRDLVGRVKKEKKLYRKRNETSSAFKFMLQRQQPQLFALVTSIYDLNTLTRNSSHSW